MHLILTPGLDVHQRLLCSVDIFTEGNIEISLCIRMEVISYVNFGQNLSQKTRVGLCAKAAGADPLPTQLNPSCPSCETHLGTAALPVSRRIGLHLAEASPNATLRSWFWLFCSSFSWFEGETDGVWSIPAHLLASPVSWCRMMDLLGAGCEFQLWHQAIDLRLFALLVSFLNPWSWGWRQEKIFHFVGASSCLLWILQSTQKALLSANLLLWLYSVSFLHRKLLAAS